MFRFLQSAFYFYKMYAFFPQFTGSAEVAIAVFLGICILVVLAVIGYCYLKKKRSSSRRRQPTVNNNAIATTEDTEHLVYNRTTKPV